MNIPHAACHPRLAAPNPFPARSAWCRLTLCANTPPATTADPTQPLAHLAKAVAYPLAPKTSSGHSSTSGLAAGAAAHTKQRWHTQSTQALPALVATIGHRHNQPPRRPTPTKPVHPPALRTTTACAASTNAAGGNAPQDYVAPPQPSTQKNKTRLLHTQKAG
jgi:hypothetical protein